MTSKRFRRKILKATKGEADMADNKFTCPKCGKRAWKKTHRGDKLRCTALPCTYVSPVMTETERNEILNYIPIPPTPLEACMEEIRDSSEWIDEWGVHAADYIDLDILEDILEKYLSN